jgi:hypothetical protein
MKRYIHLLSWLFAALPLWAQSHTMARHTYTYQPELPKVNGQHEGSFSLGYDSIGLSNAEKSIYEQIATQIELLPPDTTILKIPYCETKGIKTDKSNPITATDLPKFTYEIEHITLKQTAYFTDYRKFIKSAACLGISITYHATSLIYYPTFLPNIRQLVALKIKTGIYLAPNEKWLIEPYYATATQLSITPQHLRPITIKSNELDSLQIGILLQKKPLKWQQSSRKMNDIQRIRCFLSDKGYYAGPIDNMLNSRLRQAITQYAKDNNFPTCIPHTFELKNIMEQESY